MPLIKELHNDKLNTKIYSTRAEMGAAAAKEAAARISELLKTKDTINVIFAAAPSQNETLNGLISNETIEWQRINAFHMDEYVGLPDTAPQRFGNFLQKTLFSKVPFRSVNYITGKDADKTYASLLEKNPPDIVLLGIGENGHIAFNDPHVADFCDKKLVKKVSLDKKCRRQQVNDGCFPDIDSVPEFAITLTIPALMRAKYLICSVPAKTKADAVFNTVFGNIDTSCPATAMRKHDGATMFCDKDSGKYIMFNLSVITDEISQDPEIAIKLSKKYHLSGVELRSVYDKPIEELHPEKQTELAKLFKTNGLKVSAISTSFLKCDWGTDDNAKLDKIITACKIFGCNIIRGFSFWKSPDYNDKDFAKILSVYGEKLVANNLTLVIENDPSVNLATGEDLACFFSEYKIKNVSALWDAGNDIYSHSALPPYPDEYEMIRPYIGHVHLKDAVKTTDGASGRALGEGELNLKGQLFALLKDGYNGWTVIETHYKKTGEISEELLKVPMGQAFSENGYESTEECIINLHNIIKELLGEF